MSSSVENIRAVCLAKSIPIYKVERDLGFANGYLNPKKVKNVSYERLKRIADYLDVSVEVLANENLLSGSEPEEEGKLDRAITLFQRAEPWLQEQILMLLESAESNRASRDDHSTD